MHAVAALFLDTYRQINSQKLFWITLALSVLVVAGFAALGIDEKGLTILWWNVGDLGGVLTSELMSPAQLYKMLFVSFGIKFWLAWLATILALISTAGMIPSFVQGGAIELTLSKPVRRVTLFLLKFLMGLLFTALQVGVFTLACFLLIGIRGGEWQPKVFLAIPLVVLFYSYLFSICALLGLVTRSTIAALLLTLLCWLGLFSLNFVDVLTTQFKVASQVQVESLPKRIATQEREARRAYEALWYQEQGLTRAEAADKGVTPPEPSPAQLRERNARILKLEEDLADAQRGVTRWTRWSGGVFALKTALPKTSETTDLLERSLMRDFDPFRRNEELSDEPPPETPVRMANMSDREQAEVAERLAQTFKSRSVWWIIGTSLAFEAAVLGLACFIFARRDF